MKKSILKSLEPKTKSLFRFKNVDNKINGNGASPTPTTVNTDPTITTTATVTW